MSQTRIDVRPLFTVLLLLPLIAVFVFIDVVSGWTPWPVPLAFTALALFTAWGCTRHISRAARCVLLAGVIVAFIGIWRLPWNTRKPFLQDLDSIEAGMTTAEVESIMGKYMRGTGWPTNRFEPRAPLKAAGASTTYAASPNASGELQLDDAIVYRHTNEAWGNSDWGVVKFKEGRVLSVEFLPD